jgi:molybdopterin-binding protein
LERSILTGGSASRGIKVGSEVIAIVKASDVMLAVAE